MRSIGITDILTALKHADPDKLAAAIYADRDPQLLATLADSITRAAEHVAQYPHAEVVAEADAALYEVLTWPVADAIPPGYPMPDADELAHTRNMTIKEARRLLDRIAATETLAATELRDSHIEPNFTVEQAQVTRCINDLLDDGRIPTRASVRAHALNIAAQSTPVGCAPIVASTNGLPSRILSNSSAATVPGWIARMDANPPMTGLLRERLAFIRAAKEHMGQANRHHTQTLVAVEHARMPGTSAPGTSAISEFAEYPRVAG